MTLPPYKTVVADLSMAGMAITAIASLLKLVPPDNQIAAWSLSVALAALGVIGAVNTHLTGNEAALTDAANAIRAEIQALADSHARTQAAATALSPAAADTTPSEVPAPAPTAAAPVVEDVATVLARHPVT
ncbi:hypothetical protein IU500_06875 [Nocardia terpenica]|uniref:hypothetical protein n=1 Tax=Nocardia terpenica TaxID=455432 RepID=UPI001894B1D5|nr:hypothetical protein [Nocardia terpenica]MBF6060499.1 hypothetical protein [Nocardia terpenica]MBF6103759.1 hypothetical protein [Nocardia terpenica]MBF6111867.1 hypothetical protein [Nocardia terpenica]MBF6117980.1 hypothetical protein [Nocardia terpenica]MBF6155294.1 hypothetical protein [Nocardia terpenica]